MKKAISILSLLTALLVVSACATTAPPNGEADYTRVDLTTAKTLFDRDVLFIDMRGMEYNEGHIRGAIHLDWNKTFSEVELARIASKNQEVVLYCYGSCYISRAASSTAVSWGYEKVYQFEAGYPKWKSAGYPIE